MKKFLSLIVLLLTCVGVSAQSWLSGIPESGAYNDYTVVYAQLTTNLAPTTGGLVIGAFIEDKCRVSVSQDMDATGAPKTTNSGNPLYTIVVPGNLGTVDTDLGKTITFKVYDPGTGYEYALTNTLSFDGGTYGDPPSSNAIFFTLNAATSFAPNIAEVEVGKTYNLRDPENMTIVPDGATIPDNIVWTVYFTEPTTGVEIDNYVSLKDGILQGISPCKGLAIDIKDVTGGTMGTPCYFNVVLHATSIELIQPTTIKVKKDDKAAMKTFMTLGTSYKVEPVGATDEVLWEKQDDKSILTWDETDSCYVPTASGTAKIRPYIVKPDQTRLYPANDEWITVEVVVYATRITIDYSLFQEDPAAYQELLKANVGDTHLYDRIKRMITVLPADATDKSYKVSIYSTSEILKLTTGNDTTITALKAGNDVIAITANGADPNSTEIVTGLINVQVVKPVTATANKNPLYINLTDGNQQDITADIQANVKLEGNATDWAKVCTVTLSGDNAVTCPDPKIDDSGVAGTYTAVAVGTTTFTINIRWPDYDAWGVSGDALDYKSSQATFDIVVQNEVLLTAFDVVVTNAVAGQAGTITLTPQPAGATFDPDDIVVSIYNKYATASTTTNPWEALLNVGIVSETKDALVYSFNSTIPGIVTVTAEQVTQDPTGGNSTTKSIPLNGSTSTDGSYTFDIAYPLNLATGWQWVSIPYGAVPTDQLVSVFSTTDLTEIRTSDKLLYNDPNWQFYGTLTTGDGIKQGQLFKVNMKNARTTTLFGSQVTDTQLFGKPNADGTTTVTLNPGWNWVGSPYFFNHKFDNVFNGYSERFTDGAIIIGKNGAVELSSGVWSGLPADTYMKAGEGYAIYNPNRSAIDVKFPAETEWQPVNEDANAGVKGMNATAHVWEYDHSRFMNNMTMVAELVDIEHPEQYSIGAFVGDECRGEGAVIDGKAFITVHCDAGEYVTFKLYSPYTNEFYTIEEGLKAESRIGSMKAPFKMHAFNVVDGINNIAGAGSSSESYDLSGRRVSSQQQGISIRRTADGKMHKVIVK